MIMGTTLRKITEMMDLLKCSATSRILVNGEIAGIVFPLSSRAPIFVRKEEGVVYCLRADIDEMRYLPDGSIETDSPWERCGNYVDGQHKLMLEYLGILD